MNAFYFEKTNWLPDSKTFSCGLASVVYRTGRRLVEPCNHGLALIEQVAFRSLVKDVHGRHSSLWVEGVKRVSWLALGTALFALGLIPFAVGGVLMALSNLAKKDMTYIQPKDADAVPSVYENGFKLTTINVGALPEWITVINKLRPLRQRMDEFVENVMSETQQADCICIQELFDQTAIAKVAKNCRSKYPYMIVDVCPRTIGMNSGLAILSKYPIKRPAFHQFRRAAGEDRMANKGILEVEIQLNPGKKVTVFNTHFPAGSKQKYREIKREIIKGIGELYRKYVSAAETHTVFTVGDLNISRYKGFLGAGGQLVESQDWKENEPFISVTNHDYGIEDELSAQCDGTTWNATTPFTLWSKDKKSEWSIKSNRVDYILALQSGSHTPPTGSVKRDFDLSLCTDHLGLVGEFEI